MDQRRRSLALLPAAIPAMVVAASTALHGRVLATTSDSSSASPVSHLIILAALTGALAAHLCRRRLGAGQLSGTSRKAARPKATPRI